MSCLTVKTNNVDKMKYKKIPLIVFGAILWSSTGKALNEESDSLGLPGDNFDLYGALELFKNAESLEDFEKSINSEDKAINNLDLNEDGDIDYVRVVDHVDGEAHAVTLEIPINDKESQSIAVIEIEKTDEETVGLQVVGDETMYGKDYIIEPFEEEEDNMPSALPGVRIVVNVWPWRPIRFIYAPAYRPWVSPYRWAYYPKWWRPWRPVAWHVHRNRCLHYRVVHVHRVHVHRHPRAHRVYHTHRVSSTTVQRRTTTNSNSRRSSPESNTRKDQSRTSAEKRSSASNDRQASRNKQQRTKKQSNRSPSSRRGGNGRR